MGLILPPSVRSKLQFEADRRGLSIAQKRQSFTQYQNDPVRYAAERLQVKLTDDQNEILNALVTHRRIAVLASHGIGKTFVASVAATWWYECWPEHIAYITAPSWSQALGLTFKSVRVLFRLRKIAGEVLRSGLIRDRDERFEPGHYIKALNASTGEGFQGEHSAPILIILEEAVGVPSYIWDAADGLMTMPECRMLCICNPTDESTQMGLAAASPIYKTMSISGLTHPNIVAELAGKPAPYPKAVRLTWIEEMIAKECSRVDELGPDAFEFPPGSGIYYLPNALFQGRVLGTFPTQADSQVIASYWLANLPVLLGTGMPSLGVDVARFGSDRSTFAGMQGPVALLLKEVRKFDIDAVAGQAIICARQLADICAARGVDKKAYARSIPIRVDSGGLGVGVCTFLGRAGYNVIEVNAASKAIESEKYPNKRSELWFTTRDKAREKDFDLSRLEPDIREKLVKELTTPTWKPDSKGRKVVEKKEDIKKRLGESPDLADAFNLANDGTGDWEAFARAQEQGIPPEYEELLDDSLASEASKVRW